MSGLWRSILAIGAVVACAIGIFFLKGEESPFRRGQEASPRIAGGNHSSIVESENVSGGKHTTVIVPAKVDKIALDGRPPLSRRELQQLIASDQICLRGRDGESLFPQSHVLDKYFALQAVLNKRRSTACMGALFAKQRSVALAHSKEADSDGCLFMRALVLSSLWEGLKEGKLVEPTQADLEAAKVLLGKLVHKNPQNGVYPFFLLPVLDRLNASRDEQEKAFGQFLAAKKFENPLIPYGIELVQEGMLNASAFLFMVDMYTSFNGPNYMPAYNVAKNLVRDSLAFPQTKAWLEYYFRRQMHLRKRGLGEPYLWLIEEVVLRGIAAEAWQAQYPGQKMPSSLEADAFRESFYKEMQQRSSMAILTENSFDSCEQSLSWMRKHLSGVIGEEKRRFSKWMMTYK